MNLLKAARTRENCAFTTIRTRSGLSKSEVLDMEEKPNDRITVGDIKLYAKILNIPECDILGESDHAIKRASILLAYKHALSLKEVLPPCSRGANLTTGLIDSLLQAMPALSIKFSNHREIAALPSIGHRRDWRTENSAVEDKMIPVKVFSDLNDTSGPKIF